MSFSDSFQLKRGKASDVRTGWQIWGHWTFVVMSFIGLVRSVRGAGLGHWKIFTSAARTLWAGGDPYGTDFGSGVGLWFYSPSCGMLIFGPFALLPDQLGLGIFLGLSWGVFVFGASRLWTSFGVNRVPTLFWFSIAPAMMVSLLAAKLEILMMGLLMSACGDWIRASRARARAITEEAGHLGWEPALVLGALLNWKFQPLPTIGLLSLVWVLRPHEPEPRNVEMAAEALVREDEISRRVRFPVHVFLFCALWFALPLIWFGPRQTLQIYQHWQETLNPFMNESFQNFDNLFAFLREGFGWRPDFSVASRLAVVVGALMAGIVFVRLKWPRFEQRWITSDAAALALGLGAVFTVGFSPLSQNNAHVLLAPLMLSALLAWKRLEGDRLARWVLGVALTGLILVLDIAYSDLIPTELRNTFRSIALKPAAIVAFGAVLAALWLRVARLGA